MPELDDIDRMVIDAALGMLSDRRIQARLTKTDRQRIYHLAFAPDVPIPSPKDIELGGSNA